MKIHEYQGKEILKTQYRYTKWHTSFSVEEALELLFVEI